MSADSDTDAFLEHIDITLDGILDEYKRRQDLAQPRDSSEQRSKVEVKTSTRGTDVTVTVYTGTTAAELRTAGDLAVAEYRRTMRELGDQKVAAFAEEVNRREAPSARGL